MTASIQLREALARAAERHQHAAEKAADHDACGATFRATFWAIVAWWHAGTCETIEEKMISSQEWLFD